MSIATLLIATPNWNNPIFYQLLGILGNCSILKELNIDEIK
jgi:hypothetical protein